MIEKTKTDKIQYRFFLNIVSLFGLSIFIIISPVIKPPSAYIKPAVKAAFFSEPSIPVSKDFAAPNLTATGIYILDINSGAVLYQKNAHLRHFPASLTKIMTALVAMDYFDEDSILQVKNGQDANGNKIDLIKGDKLLASDMFYALLVPSGNDAAVTLAENYPGGYQAFISRMNTKAVEMGLQNTHFSNVSGVESQKHFTTAHDITLIAKTALSRPVFSSIVSTKKVTLKSIKGNLYPLESTNLLLGTPGFYGVKTGWTPEAGECLVILAEKDNHPIIITVLNSKDRFGEAKLLFDWSYSNYSWEN